MVNSITIPGVDIGLGYHHQERIIIEKIVRTLLLLFCQHNSKQKTLTVSALGRLDDKED